MRDNGKKMTYLVYIAIRTAAIFIAVIDKKTFAEFSDRDTLMAWKYYMRKTKHC